MTQDWINEIKWNEQGLVPAIAQEHDSGRVLMMAWMNPEALAATIESGMAVYWSRSRQSLWRKGEQSGNEQQVKQVSLDCDGDTVLLLVEQNGGVACHTGRHSCFYRVYNDGGWESVDPVLKDPAELYK